MTEAFVPEKFKKAFRSYYWKWGIFWAVSLCFILALNLDKMVRLFESSIASPDMVSDFVSTGEIVIAGLFANGAIAIGGGLACGFIAIGGLMSIGVIAIGGGISWGVIAIGGTQAWGVIAISGIYGFGLVAIGGMMAIGSQTCGYLSLSYTRRCMGRHKFSPNHQDEQAVKFFTHFMPKLKSAFSSTHNG
ncbi:MAG: hypothetical protein OXM61_08705 [Candidatus Poribacteria bacterium]|nr:hypothetical protein [Candidatus Poribacteria bacterium]